MMLWDDGKTAKTRQKQYKTRQTKKQKKLFFRQNKSSSNLKRITSYSNTSNSFGIMNSQFHDAIVDATEKVAIYHQSDWGATLLHISRELGDGAVSMRNKVGPDIMAFRAISQEQFVDTDKPREEQLQKWRAFNMMVDKKVLTELTKDFIVHLKEGMVRDNSTVDRHAHTRAKGVPGNTTWRTFSEYLMFLRDETNITIPITPISYKTSMIQFKVDYIKRFMDGVDWADMFNSEREMQLDLDYQVGKDWAMAALKKL